MQVNLLLLTMPSMRCGVQMAATGRLRPMRMPLPVKITQPALISLEASMTTESSMVTGCRDGNLDVGKWRDARRGGNAHHERAQAFHRSR